MNAMEGRPRARWLLVVLTLVAVVACFGSQASFGTNNVLAASLTLHTPFSGSAACDIDCGGTGTFCDSDQHDAWETTPPFYRWNEGDGVHAFPEDCRAGTCDLKHGPYCPTLEALAKHDDLEGLRHAAAQGDVSALVGAVIRSSRITVNKARSAIQVLNCKGGVTMHLPLAQAVADAVSSRTAAY